MKSFIDKVRQVFKLPGTHDGTIEWEECCDVPSVATSPAPLDPGIDDALWREFLTLDRQRNQHKETP